MLVTNIESIGKKTQQNNMSVPFKPEPLQITHNIESMITAQNTERVTKKAALKHARASPTAESPTARTDESNTVEPVETPALALVESPTLRRSVRARRMPEHFKDYVF